MNEKVNLNEPYVVREYRPALHTEDQWKKRERGYEEQVQSLQTSLTNMSEDVSGMRKVLGVSSGTMLHELARRQQEFNKGKEELAKMKGELAEMEETLEALQFNIGMGLKLVERMERESDKGKVVRGKRKAAKPQRHRGTEKRRKV